MASFRCFFVRANMAAWIARCKRPGSSDSFSLLPSHSSPSSTTSTSPFSYSLASGHPVLSSPSPTPYPLLNHSTIHPPPPHLSSHTCRSTCHRLCLSPLVIYPPTPLHTPPRYPDPPTHPSNLPLPPYTPHQPTLTPASPPSAVH